MFQVCVGMGREALLDLSIPEMVDMIDYYQEVRSGG